MDVFIHPCFADWYGRHPLVLADAGARGGLKKNWLAARPHLRVLGFEPDRQEYGRLLERTRREPGGDSFFNVALHNRPGPLTLHVARDPGLTSVFEPNRAFLASFPDAGRFETVDRREVEADTLDHVLQTNQVTDLDFIKADTQGSELFVLEGASRALATSVVGVEVEVEFAPIYKDQPLFAEVDAFLRGLGYFLFDLRPCYWKREAGRTVGGPHGQIIWGDALYLKSQPALDATIAPLDRESQKTKMLHAVSIALLYGYADYALEIARRGHDVWSQNESAVIEQQLRHVQGSRDSRARQLASALRQFWPGRRDANDAWSVSDAELGNLD